MSGSSSFAHDAYARATIVVSDSSQIASALKSLAEGGGGTLLLDGAAGAYDIDLKAVGESDAPILIAPLDPETPPVVSKLHLDRCAGLTVTGMQIGDGTKDGQKDIYLTSSQNLALVGNTMTGTAEGFYSEAGDTEMADTMMYARYCRGLTFADNTVSNYFSAIGMLDCAEVDIERNDFSKLQGDGIQGGAWDDVRIANNYMHDFYGSTQSVNHSDMIQIWGSSTSFAARNVEITGNVLNSGDGALTQGIFIRNEEFGTGKKADGYLENITITNNTLYNGAPNGIYVANAKDLIVSNNTVLWDQDATTYTSPSVQASSAIPSILVRDSIEISVEKNISGKYQMSDLTAEELANVQDNQIIDYSNPSSDSYAPALFNNLLTNNLDLRDLMLRDESDLDGYGATIDLSLLQDAVLVPIILPEVPANDPRVIQLEAGLLNSDGTVIDSSQLRIVWTFSDGAVLQGTEVARLFTEAGDYHVTMEVQSQDGETLGTVTRGFEIESPILTEISFDGDISDSSGRDTVLKITDPGGTSLTDGRDGRGFHLSSGHNVELTSKNAHLYSLDSFQMDLDVKLDSATAYGDLVSQHTVSTLFVSKSGILAFSMTTSAGTFSVKAPEGMLADAEWHSVGVVFDGVAGTLQLVVDEEIVDESLAQGQTSGATPWGIVIGSAFSTPAAATVDNFKFHRPVDDPADMQDGLFTTVTEQLELEEFLFDFDFNGDAVDASDYATVTTSHTDAEDLFVTHMGREGVSIGGSDVLELSRTSAHLSELDAFTLSFSLAKTDADASGGLMSLHTLMDLDIRSDGSLMFWILTDEGKFGIATEGGLLADTEWHDIDILYSDAEDTLYLYLDDDLVGSRDGASGTTGELTHWPMVLGETWGSTVEAVIDNFSMTVPIDDIALV